MKKITYILVILIALSAALKWFLYFSFRINYYEVLILLFICLFLLSNYKVQSFRLKKELKTYLLFLWGWVFLGGLSGCGVLFYPQGGKAYSFYLKGMLQFFVHSIFFTFLIFYLSSITLEKRSRLVFWFLTGIVISSIYGFGQLILKMQYGIDIDENISRYLGMSLANGEYLNFNRYAYGYLYRLNGITGDPSVHAAYTIMAIPLLLLGYITNKKFTHLMLFLVIFISLILSMSGSGLVGFMFACLTLVILRIRQVKVSQLALFLFLAVILVYLYSSYGEHIRYYSSVRFDPHGTIASHIDIAIKSLKVGMKYPLGVGYNNFSIAYENLYGILGYNPHNSWLAYFVQMGFIGFLYQVIFSIFIIARCLKKKTNLSHAFIASYVGICIAALGYEILEMFYTQLFITMFFTVVMLEESRKKPITIKMASDAKTTDYYCQKDLSHQA